jgi:cytochrome c oxidase assembly protein Cox11
MRGAALSKNTTETLVQLFAELAVEQDRALLLRTISTVNKIYDKLEAIESELKSRPGDQRSALLPLFNHKNMQVRVKSAMATLAVAPAAARAQLEAIRASGWQPQALEAGMSLGFLDDGVYKPK